MTSVLVWWAYACSMWFATLFCACFQAKAAVCGPGGVAVSRTGGESCVWSPQTNATDISDTYIQCARQGGQPFTFASIDEVSSVQTLLSIESVEVFVPAVRTNDSYHWFSVANNTDNIETFFSEDVIDRDVIGKQCVTLLGSNFTAQDCASSQFRFICQRDKNSAGNDTCFSPNPPSDSCPPQAPPASLASLGATADPASTADNSSTQCVLQDDGSCVPFEQMLLGVFGNLKEGTLDELLNDTGTDLGDVIHARGGPSHTVWTVIRLLQGDRNRTDLSTQMVSSVDVSNMTQPEAKRVLHGLYDLLVADNSTQLGLDDRVAALLFKMAYVSSVDDEMLTVFAKSAALVIYGEGRKAGKKATKQSRAVRVLQSMERILTTSNVTCHQQQLTQFVVRVVQVKVTQAVDDVTLDNQVDGRHSSIRLSASIFPMNQGRVSSVIYSGIRHLLPSNREGALKGGRVASHVMSVVVHNGLQCGPHSHWCHAPHSRPHGYLDFTINFTLPYLHTQRASMANRRWCVHWKFKMGVWSEDGCWLLERNTTHTTCTCNHLTTFAVLVTFTPPAKLSAGNVRVMFVLTAIGCSLSIAGLAITLFTYVYLRIVFRERILIHASLALSLLLAQVLFISSDHAHQNEVACKAVAALLHFLFMSAFCWMLVEGVALYRTCTRGLLYACDMRVKYSLLGWGLPLVVVLISLGIEFPNYGHGLQNSCWLSVEKGLIWAFLAPMLVIVSLNVLILCLVIRVFLTLRANSQKPQAARARAGVRAMVMLLPLLGTTWLLSLLVPLSPVFTYLFILCNSLQGLMIFVLHCLSSEEVRRFLARRRGTSRSRTRTSESNLSVVGWRRRSPALMFDDVKHGATGRAIVSQSEGRRKAWL